jgi:hypothetical protein
MRTDESEDHATMLDSCGGLTGQQHAHHRDALCERPTTRALAEMRGSCVWMQPRSYGNTSIVRATFKVCEPG